MKILRVMLPAAMMLFAGCKEKKDNSKEVFSDPVIYSKTVKKLNDVVLENNFPPMIASRNYAYANIAAYECIVAGDNNYVSLAGQVRRLPAMPKPDPAKPVDFNLAALFAFTKVGNAVTFPEGSMMAHYDELKAKAVDAGMPGNVLANTIAFSDTVAATILKWSKTDNYAQTRSAEKYTVNNEDGRWVPTPPMYAQAVEPHWNQIKCLFIDSCAQFMPPRPPAFDIKNKQSVYYKYMQEVKNIGENLTEEQKDIADFWDDNPFKLNVSGHVMFATKKFSPAGHWMNIVGIAAQKTKADFSKTVAAYTETSIALFEGFIICWDEKYRSNFIRPETAINKYVTEEWHPYIQTPPFPSYVSGHATISAAAAEVMTNWFGDNVPIMDTSSLEFGIKARELKSFRLAAQEAGMSRLYGGIHYRFDNEEGNKCGTMLGEYLVEKLRFKKNTDHAQN
jgi:hypothetical protein